MSKSQVYDFTPPLLLSIGFIIGMTAYLGLLFIQSIRERSEAIADTAIKESAWIACVLYIEERLEVPRQNVQQYTLDRATKLIEKDHYGVEVLYTDGHIYECDLARRVDGEWFLKSLYVK